MVSINLYRNVKLSHGQTVQYQATFPEIGIIKIPHIVMFNEFIKFDIL